MHRLSLLLPKTKYEAEIYAKYPLDESKSQIRLLEILSPSYLPDGDDIRVRFHTVSLSDKPRFCALSYLWGDPSDTEPVTIEIGFRKTTTLQITKNLASALRSVKWHYENELLKQAEKEREKAEKIFRIWADALCISQIMKLSITAKCVR